jgi:hypothetical protein
LSRTTNFNIQKFYMVLTLCWSVLYGLLPCKTLRYRFCITEVDSVYCAVRTQPLYTTDPFAFKGLRAIDTVSCYNWTVSVEGKDGHRAVSWNDNDKGKPK